MPQKQSTYLWQARARSAVRRAIIAGTLEPLWELACVDCGAPAILYDHRDYGKPLAVAPVCGRCNKKRGPGRIPAYDPPMKSAKPVFRQQIVREDVPELPSVEINLEAFRRWGKIGGKARAKRLSPERRTEIARIAGSAPKRKRSKPEPQGQT